MKRFVSPFRLLPAVALVASFPLSASAASQCSGLTEQSCAAAGECRWVGSYVRKDGREVAGYCRSDGQTRRDGQAQAGSPKAKTSGS